MAGGRPACPLPWGRGRVRAGRSASVVGVGDLSSVPLPPLHGHQGGLRWRCFGHGGCGLHTAPVCVRVLLPGRGPRGVPWGVLVLCWATGGPGGQARGPADPGGGAVPACCCAFRGLQRSLGIWGGDGQGARGTWTQRRAWRGTRPRVLRRRGAPRRRSSLGGRGGEGAVPSLCGGARGRRGAVAPGSAVQNAIGPPGRSSPLRGGLVWFGMPGRRGSRSGALCTLPLLHVAPCPCPAQDTSSGTSQ